MKKLLCVVLTLVMLSSMIVVPAYAQEQSQAQADAGYCQHCKENVPESQWMPWDPGDPSPKTGHYYLAEDINSQTAQITINLDDDFYRHAVCLDLRGRTYTVAGLCPFIIYGILSIQDSVGGGEIAVAGTSKTHGGFAQMSKKSNSVDGAGELNIYSGTLRKINDGTNLVSYGGLLYMTSGSTLNLRGGKLIGGEVVGHTIGTTNYAPKGGAIYARGANINISGGTLTGGYATDTVLTKSDGTTANYEASGGNIYAESSSVIHISGGVVENGYSDTYGGNMTVSGSTLTISGGTIRNGYSEGASGNIQFGGTGKLTISGGTIRDGVAVSRGGNLFVNNTNADIEITGGEIYGDMAIGVFKSFVLSGTPKIYMGNSNGLDLFEARKAEAMIDASGLSEGAEIYLDGTDGIFTQPLTDPATTLTYFKDAIRADITVDEETNALQVTQGTTGFCPHCWQEGKQATWVPFNNDPSDATITISSTSTTHKSDENNQYHTYFTEDIARTKLIQVGTSSDPTDVVIDMAGNTLTVTGYKFSNLYGTLSLIDSAGWGVIAGTGHVGANGGVIMAGTNSTFNMYSGVLKRTVKSGEASKRIYRGGVIYGGYVNVYGGTISGGVANTAYSSNSPKNPAGGNVYAQKKFTMTAGALRDGTSSAFTGYVTSTSSAVTGTAVYSGNGGNLYLKSEGEITGGHIVGGSATYGAGIYVYKTGSLTMTGGSVRGGVCNDAGATSNYGGNICAAGAAKTDTAEEVRVSVSLSNALIRSGTANKFGGNIYASYVDLDIQDGTLIADGQTGYDTNDDNTNARGGNLYLASGTVMNLTASTIANGKARGIGGNIYAVAEASMTMNSGLITGGTSNNSSGNIYCNDMTMYSGIITNGTAASLGGNIYVNNAGDKKLEIVLDDDDTTPAPIISNGKSGSQGGNIYLTNTVGLELTGCLIEGGTSKGLAGNIYIGLNAAATLTGVTVRNGVGDTGNTNDFNGDNIFINEGSQVTMTDSVVTGIESNNVSGNGVYSGGALTLKGSTTVTNEEQNSCVYIASAGSLHIDAGFTGTASVAFQDAHFADAANPWGAALAEQNTATGVFTGKVVLEGYGSYEYGLPGIIALEGDNKLYVGNTAVVSGTGDIRWFADVQTALEAADETSYLRLCAKESTLQISDDLRVDLNGNNLSVSGSGNVYGFDTANDDYAGNGTITLTDDKVKVQPAYLAPNGYQYVTITDGSQSTFHRLGIAITAVSLRPSIAGIYYKAAWRCDSTLQEKIVSFGVAVSTANMPDSSFATDSDTLYTKYQSEDFENGTSKTSVLIENVIKKDAENQTRGTTEIYAAPYVVLDTGLAIVSEDHKPGDGGVTYTLQSVLQAVDPLWPTLTENQRAGIKTMYNIAPETLANWELYNITGEVTGQPAHRPLKILTIGHSLAVDSGHMLNAVAYAQGYTQELVIGTLYYSGCPLYKHVNFLKNNSPVYDLYLSNTLEPNTPPVIRKGVTMEYGVAYTDWDIIIMQGGVFEIAKDAKYTDGNIQIIQDYVKAHMINKDAIFAWHMPWAPPVDDDLRNQYTYDPNTYVTNYEEYNHDRSALYAAITGCVGKYILSDGSFVYLIPSGTAVENALSSYLTEKDLHRDYVHLTDLGRVISSYTWYCILTGLDHLDKVNLEAIPRQFLKSTKDKTQDRVLTEAEKLIILEAVNNALKNPLQMTQSKYTQAPAQ